MASTQGIDLQRLRRQVAFDRLLARLFTVQSLPWLLKGGYAMELRFQSARSTKDIDLSIPAQSDADLKKSVLGDLRPGAETDLQEYFSFIIGKADVSLEAAPEGGFRFPVTANLAGRLFVKFHIDVGVGDARIEPAELLTGKDWLQFAGIAPAQFIAAISKKWPRNSATFQRLIFAAAANKELRSSAPEAYKVFLFAVFVGLRRKEIDLLEWSSFQRSGSRQHKHQPADSPFA